MPSSETIAAPRLRKAPAHGLMPREHGAYAQVGLPLLTVLLLTQWNLAVVGLVIAIASVFLAHEPALILRGHRGPRALHELGGAAQQRLTWLGTFALVGGLVGEVFSDGPTRLASVLLAALASVVVFLVATKREKTLFGEAWIASVLAFCAVPIALAGGVSLSGTLAVSVTWMNVFVMSTLAVRTVIESTRRRGGRSIQVLSLAFPVLVEAALFALAPMHGVWRAVPLALAPVSALCLVISARPPHARWLREIGWAVVACCMVTLILLLAEA